MRWVSTVRPLPGSAEQGGEGEVVCRLGIPNLSENPSLFGEREKSGKDGEKEGKNTMCAVEGCGERRKYRSVRAFQVGGCCLDHLKEVDLGLKTAMGVVSM